jgi:hypothetical protein
VLITDLDKLPWRLFLDSSVLQILEDYGEYIYDNIYLDLNAKILKMPNGRENLEALVEIMLVGQRANFEFAVSKNSLKEVNERGNVSYLCWAYEFLYYWHGCISSYKLLGNAISGEGRRILRRFNKKKFDYLSIKHKRLIFDAVRLECHAFLTIDKRLENNSEHIRKELGLKVLNPIEYWKLLELWAALFY